MRRLADDEFEAAALAFDEFVEPADRRHLDLDEALRPLGRRLFWIGAVAALARIGGLFQRGKAIADFGHLPAPENFSRDGGVLPLPIRTRACPSSALKVAEVG
jgi:hypothetical protein